MFNATWLSLVVLLRASGWMMSGQREEARTVTYVIPPGTGQQLEVGREIADFPNEINLTIGVKDILVIENQDEEIHNFGPFTIFPHTTLTKRFDRVQTYESLCTFHKDQQMKIVVNPAPWDIFR